MRNLIFLISLFITFTCTSKTIKKKDFYNAIKNNSSKLLISYIKADKWTSVNKKELANILKTNPNFKKITDGKSEELEAQFDSKLLKIKYALIINLVNDSLSFTLDYINITTPFSTNKLVNDERMENIYSQVVAITLKPFQTYVPQKTILLLKEISKIDNNKKYKFFYTQCFDSNNSDTSLAFCKTTYSSECDSCQVSKTQLPSNKIKSFLGDITSRDLLYIDEDEFKWCGEFNPHDGLLITDLLNNPISLIDICFGCEEIRFKDLKSGEEVMLDLSFHLPLDLNSNMLESLYKKFNSEDKDYYPTQKEYTEYRKFKYQISKFWLKNNR